MSPCAFTLLQNELQHMKNIISETNIPTQHWQFRESSKTGKAHLHLVWNGDFRNPLKQRRDHFHNKGKAGPPVSLELQVHPYLDKVSVAADTGWAFGIGFEYRFEIWLIPRSVGSGLLCYVQKALKVRNSRPVSASQIFMSNTSSNTLCTYLCDSLVVMKLWLANASWGVAGAKTCTTTKLDKI